MQADFSSRNVHEAINSVGVLMPYSQKGKSKMSNLNHAEEIHQNHLVECFCDSDWSGDKTTRCSTSSVVVFLDSIPIHSHCQGQKGISLSSCEAEILALTSGGAEAIQLRSMWEFLVCAKTSLELRSDSSSARQWLQRSGVGRLKHFAARLCWLQKTIRDEILTIHAVGTKKNVADLNTKRLTAARRALLLNFLGMVRMHDDGIFEEVGVAEREQFVLEESLTQQTRRVASTLKREYGNKQVRAIMNVLLVSQMIQATTGKETGEIEAGDGEFGIFIFLGVAALICAVFMACVFKATRWTMQRFRKSSRDAGTQTEDLAYAYVTPTGRKYHNKECPRIKNSQTRKILCVQCKQENLECCKVCNPAHTLIFNHGVESRIRSAEIDDAMELVRRLRRARGEE